jgi:hypothetical protein
MTADGRRLRITEPRAGENRGEAHPCLGSGG